jgi:hypothetical protein
MQTSPTANQLKGRAIGATFFTVFGTGWIFLALYTRQILNPMAIAWLAMVLLTLLGSAAWLYRQGDRFPKTQSDPTRGRTFMWINAIQWIAISIVAFTFARLHLDAFVICAITAIIGLHMFPLARLFRYPMHYASGSALVVWAALSARLMPVEHLQGTSAMGTGIILIASAWTTLALAATAVRRAVPVQQEISARAGL